MLSYGVWVRKERGVYKVKAKYLETGGSGIDPEIEPTGLASQ